MNILEHLTSKYFKYFFSIIVVIVVFLSFNISLNANTDPKEMQISSSDSLAHSDNIDSIEFSEVIKDVYIGDSQHSLLIDSGDFKSVAYEDSSAVLQLLEVTKDFKWAIIISMPAEIEGRAATFYILIDIKNRKNMNEWLVKQTGDYLDGNYMEFRSSENGKTMLKCDGIEGKSFEVELK